MAFRVVVHGKVQGVGYRHWTVAEAWHLGLRGWVRNRRDGTVEMTLSGPSYAVQTMLERCRQGPAAASVDRVEVHEAAETDLVSFEQRATL